MWKCFRGQWGTRWEYCFCYTFALSSISRVAKQQRRRTRPVYVILATMPFQDLFHRRRQIWRTQWFLGFSFVAGPHCVPRREGAWWSRVVNQFTSRHARFSSGKVTFQNIFAIIHFSSSLRFNDRRIIIRCACWSNFKKWTYAAARSHRRKSLSTVTGMAFRVLLLSLQSLKQKNLLVISGNISSWVAFSLEELCVKLHWYLWNAKGLIHLLFYLSHSRKYRTSRSCTCHEKQHLSDTNDSELGFPWPLLSTCSQSSSRK